MTKPDNHIDTRLEAFDERDDLAGDIMALLDDLKLDKAVCETITLRAVSFISRRDHRVWNAAIQVGRAESVQKAEVEVEPLKELTVICCNCYQDRAVSVSHIAQDIKQFYNEHRTRIGNRYCKLEDIGCQRTINVVAELTSSKGDSSLTAQEPTQEGETDERIIAEMAVVDEAKTALLKWRAESVRQGRIDELKRFLQSLDEQDPYIPLKGTPREYVHEKSNDRIAELTNSKGDSSLTAQEPTQEGETDERS